MIHLAKLDAFAHVRPPPRKHGIEQPGPRDTIDFALVEGVLRHLRELTILLLTEFWHKVLSDDGVPSSDKPGRWLAEAIKRGKEIIRKFEAEYARLGLDGYDWAKADLDNAVAVWEANEMVRNKLAGVIRSDQSRIHAER